MYELEIEFECGTYYLMANTPLSVPAEINRILNLTRKEYCTHSLLSVKAQITDKQYRSGQLYKGCCAFGN